MNVLVLRDKVVRPITITFSGASFEAIWGSDKNKDVWAIDCGKDIGSSEITGQFNLLTKLFTSATD